MHTRANRAGADATAQAVRAAGGQAEVALGDLTDPATAAALVDRATARYGGLDILVSNAGFADRTKLADLTDAAMTRSMEAIHGAFFRLARAALPHLIAGRDARIVAVSSFVSHAFRTDLAVFPASAAAKAATEALVRALAIELAPSAVTVNAVIPGFIRKDAGTHAAFTPAQAAAQTDKSRSAAWDCRTMWPPRWRSWSRRVRRTSPGRRCTSTAAWSSGPEPTRQSRPGPPTGRWSV